MNDSASEDKLRRKRSLRSLLIICFLGVVAVLILMVRARIRGPSDPDDFLEAIVSSKADVGLVAYTVGADGAPDLRDPVIRHNPNLKMPVAAVARIPLLLAYAHAVVQGKAAQDEPVSVAAWERHHLTGTDGGSHATAVRALRFHTDAQGFVVDSKRDVTLDNVVEAMIKHNDSSAADFLLQRLGALAVAEILLAAGLTNHDELLPTAGFFLAAATAKTEENAAALLAKGRPALVQVVKAAAAHYQATEANTPTHRDWLNAHPTPGVGVQSLWADQAMTQGVPGQYAALLAKVGSDHWATPKENEIVRRHLNWPLQLEGNDKLFSAFGSKGGTSVMIMNETMYAVPKNGDFAGKTRVVVFFYRRVPSLRWFAVVRSFVHQQFLMKVALDKAFAEKTLRALSPS